MDGSDDKTRDRELAELRQREKLYRTLYNNTPVMMHSADVDGNLTNVNDFWLETLGYSYVEVIGRGQFDFLSPASHRHAKETVLPEFAETGYLRDVPLQFTKKNGELIDVLLSAVDQRDSEHKLLSSFVFMVDVTERRRNEEIIAVNLALQRLRNEILAMEGEEGWEKIIVAANEELRSLIDFYACGIQLADLDHDSFVAYGVEPSETLYKYEDEHLPTHLREVIETGSTLYRRTRKDIEATDQQINAMICSIVDVPFAGGTIAINSAVENAFSERDIQIVEEFAQVLSTAYRRFQDFTALARKEEQLRQSQKMDAIGQLTAGIAHNFNNMLAGVALNLEMVLEKAPDDLHPALNDALASSLTASEMIRRLMVFTRSGSVVNFKRVDPVSLIEEVANICRKTFDRKIDIRVEYPATLPLLSGDATQLEQVLLNLCINARDALENNVDRPQSIRIEVEVQDHQAAYLTTSPQNNPGPYLHICVQDTGEGMDDETQNRLFEPFFTTKKAGKGTGLGLATAYATIKEHRGWIECQSEIGTGTTFTVYLPAQLEDAEVESPSEKPAELRGGSETILIVEDEEIVRTALRQLLELKGYTVLEGVDGADGVNIYTRHEKAIDLVVLDMSMPQMSGDEVMRRMRAADPALKVILCTGYLVEDATTKSANAVLTKPLKQQDFIRTLRQVLDEEN